MQSFEFPDVKCPYPAKHTISLDEPFPWDKFKGVDAMVLYHAVIEYHFLRDYREPLH